MTETLTEIAERETVSEEIEQTGDEPEPQTGDEPEDEPEQPEPEADEPEAQARLSEKELEKRNKQLDNESIRHEKAIHRILGEDAAPLIDCEACHPGVPGYHYPADHYAPGTAERALYEMLSTGDHDTMRHPDYLETCGECNGFGQVLTGSRTDLTRLLMCPVCKSAGYIDTRVATPPAPLGVVENGDTAVVTPPALPPDPTNDMWGRPVGHPRFGKFPIYLTEAEREADIAEGFEVG